MKEQRIADRSDLVKRDDSFIVNINKNAYDNAIRRRKLHAEKQELENRLNKLEKQVEYLMMLNSTFRF